MNKRLLGTLTFSIDIQQDKIDCIKEQINKLAKNKSFLPKLRYVNLHSMGKNSVHVDVLSFDNDNIIENNDMFDDLKKIMLDHDLEVFPDSDKEYCRECDFELNEDEIKNFRGLCFYCHNEL